MATMAINIKVGLERENKIILMFIHQYLFPRFDKTVDGKNLYIDVSTIDVLKIFSIISVYPPLQPGL